MSHPSHFLSRGYGWQKDLPDQRDYFYAAPVLAPAPLPAKVDLRPQCPPIYDQGQLGSCTANASGGVQIPDDIKSAARLGDCPEPEWPHDNAKFKSKPGACCREALMKFKVVSYQRMTQALGQLKGCLTSGWPFVFGFKGHEGFEIPVVAKSGHVPRPASSEAVVGGHAVVGVGYDDAKQWFIVRNSWGAGWGWKGCFTLPYAYVGGAEPASDFWTLRVVQ